MCTHRPPPQLFITCSIKVWVVSSYAAAL